MTGPSPTLGQVLERWLTARAVTKPSPHTLLAYRADIGAITVLLARDDERALDEDEDSLSRVRLAEVTVSSLRSAFAAYADTHSKASIARAQSSWRGLCGFAVAEGWLPGDPMSGVPRVHAPRREPKPLRGEAETAAALLTFLAGAGRSGRDPWPARDLAVVALLLLTGLRSAEAREVTVGDIFGQRGAYRIRVTGKGDKQRTIPIEDSLYDLLEAYLREREARFPRWRRTAAAPLLVSTDNVALTVSQLRYLVSSSLRQAGLGGTVQRGALVHALRHTFATTLVDQGATATEVMELLGHASLTTSQGYVRASARELRASAAANPLYRVLPSVGEAGSGDAS